MSSIKRNSKIARHVRRTHARKSKSTHKNLLVSLRKWTNWVAENGLKDPDAEENEIIDISRATKDDLDDWIDALRVDNYTDKSILNYFYDVSKTYREIGHDIGEGVDTDHLSNSPHINKEDEIRYIKITEYEQLLDACNDTREILILTLLWETGVRAGEASDITIEDINRDEQYIKIRTGKQRRGDSSTRKVWYGRSLKTALKNWLDRGKRNAYLHSDTSRYLFLTKQSDHMPTQRLGEIVHDIAERAGLQSVIWTTQDGRPQHRIHTHTFRHSFAVHRVKKGMPIVFLQDLMGHADIDVTRQYLHFRDEDIEDAAHRYRP